MAAYNMNETRLEAITKNVRNTCYLLGVIGTICTSIYITIDRTFESKVSALNANMEQRLTAVEMYTQDDISKNIIKQAEKITTGNFDDIKMVDIEDALRYYSMIEKPSQKLQISFETIKEYYKSK